MPPLEERIDQAMDEMRRGQAELKGEIFHLRTDVARSSSDLRRTVIKTGGVVVLVIALGVAAFLSSMNGAHESGKSDDSSALGALRTSLEEMRVTIKGLKDRLDGQPVNSAEKAKPAAELNCASLPADINAKAFDFSIQFPLGSAKISPDSEPTLNTIAQFLALVPGRCVLIEGYTDVTGKAEKNVTLSKDRADSVVNYLAEKAGVQRNRLVPLGKGSSSAATGLDPSDPRNRRVVFKVVTG